MNRSYDTQDTFERELVMAKLAGDASRLGKRRRTLDLKQHIGEEPQVLRTVDAVEYFDSNDPTAPPIGEWDTKMNCGYIAEGYQSQTVLEKEIVMLKLGGDSSRLGKRHQTHEIAQHIKPDQEDLGLIRTVDAIICFDKSAQTADLGEWNFLSKSGCIYT